VSSAETYALAAYLVVLAALLLYVVIYSFKLARLSRELDELAELAARRRSDASEARVPGQ
jgi:hypothetical protein